MSDIVYLDAFVPEEGRSIFDLLPPARVAVFEDAAREHGSGWNVPLPWERAIAGWGVTDPDDVAWMTPLMTPQPLATFHERAGAWATKPGVRRTFVHCLDKPAGDSFAGFAARAASDPDWRFLTLDAGHDAMIIAPAATAAALLSVVA